MSGFGQPSDSGFGYGGSFQSKSQIKNTSPFGSSIFPMTSSNANGSGFQQAQNTVGSAQQGFNYHDPPQAKQTMFGSSPNVVTNSTHTSGVFSSGGTGFNVRNEEAIRASNIGFGGNIQQNSSAFHGGTSAVSFTPSPNTQHQASSVRNPFRSVASGDKADGLTFGTSSSVTRTAANNVAPESGSPFVPTGGRGNFAGMDSTRGRPFGNEGGQSSSFASKSFGVTSQPNNKRFEGGGVNPFQSITGATHSFAGKQQPKPQNPAANGFTKNSSASASKPVLLYAHGNCEFDGNSGPGDIALDEQARRLKAKMEERKRLQAKIEEKKRKLLEKRKQQSDRSVLNAAVPSFVPGSEPDPVNKGDSEQPREDTTGFSSFRKSQGDEGNSKTRDLLPHGIKVTTNIDENSGNRDEREDLKNAVALVGTCTHMCPDDELLRRERENDIQLLEIPLPGTLHPKNWTLRNTVIKRFRRSAADYKLDVPEWVRPPDILENVCGYLEEWVMDRDRQGPDPRFPRQQVPQPLDVYQFIWNRTRMIRKDFTLQNYVGSGGKCDARAVRCHERIGRWHAMCEHQLSHIPEFTNMQSQQNIQELGQTMKTLNQFYDDDLNRSMVEVPDDSGIETRTDLSPYAHGCSADSVQGVCPRDFDGSQLQNDSTGTRVSNRLIGKHAVHSSTHGTAEAEMRGLYILLTINNDGGMEVLKYAGKLFKERPSIYHSKPVQLAMNIYKAKKEFNYVRFFQILKSPTTPYLFGCIMFKYVELMRKVAIRIMSKTYGTRRKDTGESIYDGYPLKRFRHLLCYEDDDEARHACNHYNITVKAMKVKSSESSSLVMEFIFWRKSDFKEPVHSEKGYKLPLQPRKMMKTIESKHHGATRLGICRGEASGGAGIPLAGTLDIPKTSGKMDSDWKKENSSTAKDLQSVSKNHDSQKVLPGSRIIDLDQAMDSSMTEAIREGQRDEATFIKSLQDENKQVAKNEDEKCQEQRVTKERNLRMVAEAARMAAQERVKLKAERRRKEIEVEARRKLATETRKKFETETQRRLEEIEIRRKFEVEAQRKLEYEQQRQHEREQLRRKQEKELAEERNRVEAEMEKMKAEAEARRLAVVAQALELQKAKEAEEQRKKDLKDLILFSTKTLLLRRWVRRLSRNLELIRNSRDDLQNIDPTFFKSTLYLDPLMANPADEERSSIAEQSLPAAGTRSVLETLLRLGVEKRIDLSHLVLEELATFQNVESQRNALQNRASKTRTILLKLGVVVQSHEGADRVSELVRLWISSALETGEVHVTEETSFTVRSLAVLCRNERDISDCDVVLCLHPGGGRSSSVIPAAKSVVLLLDAKYSNRRDLDERGSTAIHPKAVSTEAFESALSSACKVLTRMFLRDFSFSVERKHFFSIASQAIIKSLWMPFSSGTKNEDDIMGRSRIALLALSEEVSFKLKKNRTDLRSWPPNEFSSSTGMVDDYFSQRQGLPVNWIESVDKKGFDSEVSHLLHVFNSPLREVVTDLLGRDAPRRLKDACASMLSRRQFRGCLEKALGWRMGQIEVSSNRYIYFPSGVADSLISGVGRRLSQLLSSKSQGSPSYHIPSRFKLNISTTVDFFETGTVNQSVAANGEIQSISDDLRPLSNAKSSHTVTELVNRKKSGSRELQQHDASFSKRKKRRMEPSHRVMESSSFSKRLESFLDGETLDVQIGDKTLDSILAQRGSSLQEDVAIIKTRKQRKYGRQISNCQI